MGSGGIADIQTGFQAFLKALPDEMKRINSIIALDAYAAIKYRVQMDGKGADDGTLGKYSENQVPVFLFKNAPSLKQGLFDKIYKQMKKASGAGVKKGGAPTALLTLSYAEWREANGLEINHVDLTFTGNTWKDIGILANDNQQGIFSVTVGAENKITRIDGKTTDEIVSKWADKYGEIIDMTKQEEEKAAKTLDDELQKLLDKYL